MARTAGAVRGLLPSGARRALRTLGAPPNRRAAVRRSAAVLVSVAVMAVAVTSHHRGLELAARWGEVTPVLVLDTPVPAGEQLRGKVRAGSAPVTLVPEGHLDALPPGARAATDLARGEILTAARLRTDSGSDGSGPGHQQALVPVPLHGREGAAPSDLAPGDLVDVIGPGPHTPAGGREPARTVAGGATVRSLDADAVTLEVAAVDVPDLADALLGGPVVLVVVGGSGSSGARRSDVVDHE